MVNDPAGDKDVVQTARTAFVGSNVGVEAVFNCNDIMETDI